MKKMTILVAIVLCNAILLCACILEKDLTCTSAMQNIKDDFDSVEITKDVFKRETESTVTTRVNMVLNYSKMISPNDDVNSFVNNKIEASINDFKQQWNHEFLDGELTLELDYEIAYCSSNFVSILFRGYGNRTTAVHPVYNMFSLNLDLNERCEKTLSELVEINESFVEEFKDAVTKIEATEVINSIQSENIKLFLKSVDTSESNNISCYTENKIIVFVYYPYVVGDFVEIDVQSSIFQTKTGDG